MEITQPKQGGLETTMAGGYQFFHIEDYARSAPTKDRRAQMKSAADKKAAEHANTAGLKKGAKRKGSKRVAKEAIWDSEGTHNGGGWSAREILAEALREEGACDHVESPQAPEPMYGDLQGFTDWLESSYNPAEADGKKVRKDTAILLAGVVSAPWAPGDPRSPAWRAEALKELQGMYGENLQVIIAHNDEPHDHLHFFVARKATLEIQELPKSAQGEVPLKHVIERDGVKRVRGLLPVRALHHGHAAKQAAVDAGQDVKGVYLEAMRKLQDQWYQNVSSVHGLSRLGPRRRRLGRGEWAAEKATREAEAEADGRRRAEEAALARKRRLLQETAAEQAEEDARLLRIQEDIDKRNEAIEAKRSDLDRERAKLVAREAEVAALERTVKAAVAKLEKLVEKVASVFRRLMARLSPVERREIADVAEDLRQVEYELHPERAPRPGLEPRETERSTGGAGGMGHDPFEAPAPTPKGWRKWFGE
jgi:hypothetical protein